MSYKKIKLSHISLKALEVGHLYNYPVYFKKDDGVYTKLIQKDTKFTKDIQKQIENSNITDVFVKYKDHEEYERDTQKYLKKIIKDKDVPTSLKSEILHEMAADIINDLLDGELSAKKIDQASDIVSDTVSVILSDKTAVKAMLKVTSHDYYTYTHSVNVSTYALGFGEHLNLSEENLKILGMAGIMHDLGKRKIPSEIINKNGKLTEEEFNLMKSHPTFGVEILNKLGEDNKLLLDIIEQHHEKLDGSGYPKGLKEEQIHVFSQIMSIADIFDALTTKRSYKEAMKSFEAFNIMHNHMKKELNPKLLRRFMNFMRERSKFCVKSPNITKVTALNNYPISD